MKQPYASGDDSAEPQDLGVLPPSAAQLREAAQNAVDQGCHDEAVLLFRKALTCDADPVRVHLDYGRYLISQANSGAAEEILAAELARAGADSDLFEQYLEVVRKRELPDAHLQWALDGLDAALPDSPARHRGALDYVLEFRRLRGAEVLAHSPDPVCRAAIALDSAFDDGELDENRISEIAGAQGLPPHESNRAQAIVLLARDEVRSARALLLSMPTASVPMNSLRRAVRRALAGDRVAEARDLLAVYLQHRPEDGWALGKDHEGLLKVRLTSRLLKKQEG